MNAPTPTDLVLAALDVLRTTEKLDDRIWICDVRAACAMRDLTAEQVDEALLVLWDERRVELTRADLIFDTAKIEASEIRLETETFHYAAKA
jgi:hypothetical protein